MNAPQVHAGMTTEALSKFLNEHKLSCCWDGSVYSDTHYGYKIYERGFFTVHLWEKPKP